MFELVKDHKAYLLLLSAFLIVGVVVCTVFENQKIWGDERHYLSMAHKQPRLSGFVPQQLPGTMEYDWWPPFAATFYSLFRTEALKNHYSGAKKISEIAFKIEQARFIKRIAIVNIILLMLTSLAIYKMALLVGLGKSWSTLVLGLVLFNPRILFYLQSLWPEILHLAQLATATLFFFLYLDKKRTLYLALSGVLFGYCALTKGVAGFYVILLTALLFSLYFRQVRRYELTIILLIFLLPYLSITHVQKLKNYIVHDDYAISTNMWINIEAGLIRNYHVEKEGYKNIYDRYRNAAENPREREELSRQRVLEFITKEPVGRIVTNQLRNYIGSFNESFFAKGFRENRWKNTNKLRHVEFVSVFLSWFVFLLGVIGMLRFMFANPFSTALALFLVYYLSAMLIVGFNARFFVQAIPFLAIFTGLTLQKIFNCKKFSNHRVHIIDQPKQCGKTSDTTLNSVG